MAERLAPEAAAADTPKHMRVLAQLLATSRDVHVYANGVHYIAAYRSDAHRGGAGPADQAAGSMVGPQSGRIWARTRPPKGGRNTARKYGPAQQRRRTDVVQIWIDVATDPLRIDAHTSLV